MSGSTRFSRTETRMSTSHLPSESNRQPNYTELAYRHNEVAHLHFHARVRIAYM
jgi:hypothetical protein